jgi:DsbC/DsbD-like thiol-disulfide interchange protein
LKDVSGGIYIAHIQVSCGALAHARDGNIMKSFCLFAFAFTTLAAGPAAAASSAWHEAEGGRVRLVTSGAPDAGGRLQGVLQIDLKPGWKTYWRDPGGSGVPPSIDVSASPSLTGAALEFPPPEHHFDGQSTWAGYDQPLDLPVAFQLRAPGKPGIIEASVFLGICETICIPVQAQFSVDVAADDGTDAATVADAWGSLPGAATEQFGATVSQSNDKTVEIAANMPAGAEEAELFLAGSDGYMFGPAKAERSGGKFRFSAEIVTRPKVRPGNQGLHYTLVTSKGAVSGILPYF